MGDGLQEKQPLHRYFGMPPAIVPLLNATTAPTAVAYKDWDRSFCGLLLVGIQGHLLLLYILFYTLMVCHRWPCSMSHFDGPQCL